MSLLFAPCLQWELINVHSADKLNCFGPALPAQRTASCTLAPSLLSRLLGLAHVLTPSVPASYFSPIVCPDPAHHSRSGCGCTSIGQTYIIGDQGLPLLCPLHVCKGHLSGPRPFDKVWAFATYVSFVCPR